MPWMVSFSQFRKHSPPIWRTVAGIVDLLQRLAVAEGAIAQMRTALGDLDGAQVRAGAEGAVVDNSQGGGGLYVFKFARLIERAISDIRQGVREGDGLRILAAAENAALDAHHGKFLHAGGYLHVGHRGELFGHDGVVGVEAEGQILLF